MLELGSNMLPTSTSTPCVIREEKSGYEAGYGAVRQALAMQKFFFEDG